MLELTEVFNPSILVEILLKINMSSYSLGVNFRLTVEYVLGILTDIYYTESDVLITKLTQLRIVDAIKVCHPDLTRKLVYCQLVTNMINMRKVDLYS